MIEAGLPSQVMWGKGRWVFLDIGFSKSARSCGLLVGDGTPTKEQYGQEMLYCLGKSPERASSNIL